MGLGLIGSAILGGIGGAGDAMQANSLQEMKDAALAKREETLARLQRETHAANATFDANLKEKAQAKEEATVSDVFRNAPVPSKTPDSIYGGANQITDPAQGAEDDAGTIVVKGKEPSAVDKARAVLDYANSRGNKSAIDAARRTYEDAVKERDSNTREQREERRLKADEDKNAIANRALEIKDRELQGKLDGIIGGKRGDGGLGERKFDSKQWEQARTEVLKQFVTTDPMDPAGKEKPDHAAQTKLLQVMRGFEENSDFSPGEAQIMAGRAVREAYAAARKAFPNDVAKQEKYADEGVLAVLDREVKRLRPERIDKPSDKPGYTLPDKGAPKSAEPAKKDSPGLVNSAQEKTVPMVVTASKREATANVDDEVDRLRSKPYAERTREEDAKVKQLDELDKAEPKVSLYDPDRIQKMAALREKKRRILFGQ